METKLFTMSGVSYELEKYVSEERYQKRQNKLNKQINKLTNKVSDLNLEIEKLKEKQWKYKVGELVIANNFKVLRIVERIDEKGYLYKVIDNISCDLPLEQFIFEARHNVTSKSLYNYPVMPDDILQEYKGEFNYIKLLKENNVYLRGKLDNLSKYL